MLHLITSRNFRNKVFHVILWRKQDILWNEEMNLLCRSLEKGNNAETPAEIACQGFVEFVEKNRSNSMVIGPTFHLFGSTLTVVTRAGYGLSEISSRPKNNRNLHPGRSMQENE